MTFLLCVYSIQTKKKIQGRYYLSKLTKIKPHPVGKNARQHTIKSFEESSQTMDRVIMVAITPRKRIALNSLNARWK